MIHKSRHQTNWARPLRAGTVIMLLAALICGCESEKDGESSKSSKLSQAEVLELVRTLTGTEPASVTASSAYKKIANAGRVAQQPLIDVLQDTSEHTDVRKWAARLLGSVGDVDVVLPVLLNVLQDSVSYRWWHRAEARNGLKVLWRRQSVDVRLQYFSHENKNIRESAVDSFWLEMTDENRVARVYDALINLARNDVEWTVRSSAMNVLVYMVRETDDIGPYIEILANDSHYGARSDAAAVLGIIGNPDATQPLIDALVRSGELVSTLREIAEALGLIGDTRAVEPLLQFLFLPQIAGDSWTQRDVIEALGLLQDARAVDPLIQLLVQSPDTYVRREIMQAFGEIGDSRAAQAVIAVLENLSVDSFERATAAIALGDIGDAAAIPALEYARDNDPDSYVRSSAERALEKIQTASATGAIGRMWLPFDTQLSELVCV